MLSTHGANVVVADLADQLGHKQGRHSFNAGVQFCFGPQGDVLLDGMDTVVVSPAIRQKTVVRGAVKRGIPVISEVELGYRITKGLFLVLQEPMARPLPPHCGEDANKKRYSCVVAGNIGAFPSLEVSKVPAMD